MSVGRLIALEGIDGAGTTTQAHELARHLKSKGQRVYVTAEPSTGHIGALIREVLAGARTMSDNALALMFAADRLDHLEREIEPQLAAGVVVITDRYLLSSLAYQSVASPLEWVRQLNQMAKPAHANILLRVSPDTAAKRRATRGEAAQRFDDFDRQRHIADNYDRVFKLKELQPTFVIDAEHNLETVSAELVRVVSGILAC